jgi:hypothetical protein
MSDDINTHAQENSDRNDTMFALLSGSDILSADETPHLSRQKG